MKFAEWWEKEKLTYYLDDELLEMRRLESMKAYNAAIGEAVKAVSKTEDKYSDEEYDETASQACSEILQAIEKLKE